MSRTFVEVAYVQADGVELKDVVSFEVTPTRPNAEPVSTMNRSGKALGYKKGNVSVTGSIESKIRNPREFDWHSYLRNGTEFLIVYEEAAGGVRFQVTDCLITEIGVSHGEDGESMDRISFTALDHFEEA